MRTAIGLLLFALGAAVALGGAQSLRLWRTLRALAATTPDDLVARSRSGRLGPALLAVVGLAEPGPDGELTSTVNNEACVWHRHTVHHRQTRYRTDSSGRTSRHTSRRRVGDVASAEPFQLTGLTTGVEVRPASMRVDRPQRGRVRVLPGIVSQPFPEPDAFLGNVQNSYRHREWVVRPGTPLFVLGEVVGRGGRVVVRRPAKGPHLITTRGPQALRRRTCLSAVTGLATGAGTTVWGILVTTGLV